MFTKSMGSLADDLHNFRMRCACVGRLLYRTLEKRRAETVRRQGTRRKGRNNKSFVGATQSVV